MSNEPLNQAQMTSFGIVMAINFPLFGYLQLTPSSSLMAPLLLRAIATGLCLVLALNRLWPPRLQRVLPLYWYATVWFTLPFFFTTVTLIHGGQTLWLFNWMSALFFLYLVVDAVMALGLLVLGVLLAGVMTYVCYGPFIYQAGLVTPSGLCVSVLSAVIIGTVFSGHRDRVNHQKLLAMRLIASSIAHELRTPLASIQAAMQGWLRYLPTLLEAYQRVYAQHTGARPPIRARQLTALSQSPTRVLHEIAQANFIVDTFLTRVTVEHLDPTQFHAFSVDAVISDVLSRYPYNSPTQQDTVTYQCHQDFTIHGVPELFAHVFFNLLKNAFYFMAAEGRGTIEIHVTQDKHQRQITFTDTARGIDKHTLRHIFKRFYSQRHQGTGIGLAFCQLVVHSFAGTLRCESVLGEYTRFIMTF